MKETLFWQRILYIVLIMSFMCPVVCEAENLLAPKEQLIEDI